MNGALDPHAHLGGGVIAIGKVDVGERAGLFRGEVLGKFDDDREWAASILDKLELVILPRYNPDGVFYTRTLEVVSSRLERWT
jgi:hypothetical protein